MEKIVTLVNEVLVDAGHLALGYYRRGCTSTRKADNSIVSEADPIVQEFIMHRLQNLPIECHFLGEEGSEEFSPDQQRESFYEAFDSEYLLAVDPIDGTLNFEAGYGSWGISAGISRREIKGHLPWLGGMYFPLRDELFFTDGRGSFRQRKGEIRELAEPAFNNIEYKIFTTQSGLMQQHSYTKMKVRIPGCALQHLKSVTLGESIGSLITGCPWDISAGLAIAAPVNVGMYNLSGTKVDHLTPEMFVSEGIRKWYLREEHLVCHPGVKDAVLKALKGSI
jgi:fructose-1,6-bisphosphatase/inositol monophosphatase family enzyme